MNNTFTLKQALTRADKVVANGYEVDSVVIGDGVATLIVETNEDQHEIDLAQSVELISGEADFLTADGEKVSLLFYEVTPLTNNVQEADKKDGAPSKPDEGPRAWTPKETAEQLVKHFIDTADYWAELPNKTKKEATRGTVFSILASLDGNSLEVPGFDLIPRPTAEDKAYSIENGQNYYKEEPISWPLHEMFGAIEQAYDQGKKES